MIFLADSPERPDLPQAAGIEFDMPGAGDRALGKAAQNGLALLLRRLADLALMPAGRIPKPERDLLDLSLSHAYGQLDLVTKRRLAERTAQMAEPLPHLTRHLALDVPPVAEPLLLEGAHMPVSVLVEAAAVSEKHRALLALREEVPPELAAAILHHDDVEAVYLLLANPGSELCPRSMENAVRAANGRESWHRPLVLRAELSTWTASLLFWWVNAELRREIVRLHLPDAVMTHSTIEDTLGEAVDAAALPQLLRFFRRLPPLGADAQRAVLQAAMAESPAAGVQALSEHCGLRAELLSRVFADPGGEPAAVLARALGLSLEEAGTLAQTLGGPGREGLPENAAALFEELTIPRATALLQLWDEAMAADIAELHSQALLGTGEEGSF